MSGETVVAGVHPVVAVEFSSFDRRFIASGLKSCPATALGLSLVILGSILGLGSTASRKLSQRDATARSLARLAEGFTLIQSFQGDPRRPVPALWNARLGVKPARDLWKRQGGMLWWQAWSLDGEAYLLLPATLAPSQAQRSIGKRYGSLVVIGTDQLHREQLTQRIKAVTPQTPALREGGLFQSCLDSLSKRPSVYWTADALASLSGALAPLLQQGREGCMQLRLQGRALQWSGVIAQRPLRTSAAKAPLVRWPSDNDEAVAAEPSTLLRVDGSALQLIFGTLMSRQIIQVPLEQNYGINEALRSRISASPFSLRLVARPTGLYRAGLQLQIPVPKDQASWFKVLTAVSEKLKRRGFSPLQRADDSAPQGEQLWSKTDDPQATIVGGWRWLGDNDQRLLSVGFGIEPEGTPFIRNLAVPDAASLVVQADPLTLAGMDLLSGRWPKPMTKASTLTFEVKPLETRQPAKGLWRLVGQLTLPQS